MVISAGFTPEMRDVLSKAKGKIFKSFECAGRYGSDTFPGSFRINLGRFAIDVTLDHHPLDGDPAKKRQGFSLRLHDASQELAKQPYRLYVA